METLHDIAQICRDLTAVITALGGVVGLAYWLADKWGRR